ncbi:MAG: HDIG domain-containing protein [Planctomycetota bacterium]|nr:HDIG domain-containing protein [Planctomycetota bacterium]
MSTSGQRRTRIERVAALELPPNLWERLVERVQHADVWVRLSICAVAAFLMLIIIGGWDPPFIYRAGYSPSRDIVCRTTFSVPNDEQTKAARERAQNQVRYVYIHDAKQLEQLRDKLFTTMSQISAAATMADLPPDMMPSFTSPPMTNVEAPTKEQLEEDFKKLRELVDTKEKMANFEKKLTSAFTDIVKNGIGTPQKLKAEPIGGRDEIQGDQTKIETHPPGDSKFPLVVNIPEILPDAAASHLLGQLKTEFGADQGQLLYYWIKPKLPASTITLDEPATLEARENAAAKVEPILTLYKAGEADLAPGNVPLDQEKIKLLRTEYEAEKAERNWKTRLFRSLSVLGMFVALYTLSGFYIFFRDRRLLLNLRKFSSLILLFAGAIALSRLASGDSLRAAELIPVLLFGMTVGIAYHQELALLLTAALSLVIVVALGQNLTDYVILLSAAATSILLLGRIRTRTRLLYVGLVAGAVTALTAIGMGVVSNQPFDQYLVHVALVDAGWVIIAGILMTGLLPYVERLFDVMTDLRLLEIGDPSHPLLQELVRRAPGTYNHSINVASLAEAAAESIGARGLLVRVGAYFHDIGKMLKPGYFVENQGGEGNRHDTLMPAMSTLIIIAHIKDGADLGRQHKLPQPLIDFIQQHHGTTLVEYFFRRANQQSEADPNGSEVDESLFRYPGPKPQTKEAAVLMVADAAESASRSLVDPTPSRLESLVHELAMKRLIDGQFDDCGLTLQELNAIEDSLVKSLIAVYHGRVKYPDQRTA